MRKETTIFVFLFMILGSSFTPKFALAEDAIVETILISTDKLSYFIGDPIMISGEITNKVTIYLFEAELLRYSNV